MNFLIFSLNILLLFSICDFNSFISKSFKARLLGFISLFWYDILYNLLFSFSFLNIVIILFNKLIIFSNLLFFANNFFIIFNNLWLISSLKLLFIYFFVNKKFIWCFGIRLLNFLIWLITFFSFLNFMTNKIKYF